MPSQQWVAPANAEQASTGVAGTPLNTAATATISPTGSTAPDFILPAGTLYPGMVIRCTAQGIWSNGISATNLTLAIAYGAVTLCTTGAVAMLVSQSNVGWNLSALITCRAIGSSGTVWTQGFVTGITAAAPSTVSRMDSAVFGTPALATIDTTTASKIVLNATLSQALNSPSITCEQWLIELVG